MAKLDYEYNEEDLPTGSGQFDPIPAGWYSVTIVESELKNTKAGTGQYIKCRMDVTGPTHEGRVLFTNINIKNPNEKAEDIGRQQLGEIMRAIGLKRVVDTDELIGGSLSVKVSIKNDPKYGEGNEVKAYKSISGANPPQPTSQDNDTGSRPPWAKN